MRVFISLNLLMPSLRTADAFPVVASLPPRGGERSDDRKCVCGSQANWCLNSHTNHLYSWPFWGLHDMSLGCLCWYSQLVFFKTWKKNMTGLYTIQDFLHIFLSFNIICNKHNYGIICIKCQATFCEASYITEWRL